MSVVTLTWISLTIVLRCTFIRFLPRGLSYFIALKSIFKSILQQYFLRHDFLSLWDSLYMPSWIKFTLLTWLMTFDNIQNRINLTVFVHSFYILVHPDCASTQLISYLHSLLLFFIRNKNLFLVSFLWNLISISLHKI